MGICCVSLEWLVEGQTNEGGHQRGRTRTHVETGEIGVPNWSRTVKVAARTA